MLVAGTLALAGCGGSSTAATAGSAWTAKADVICRQLNARLVSTPPGPHASHAEIARNALQHAALEQAVATELGKLTPPAALTRDWAQILAYRRQLSTQLVALAASWKRNDIKRLRVLGRSKEKIHLKLAAIAHGDGFRDCSHVGSTATATLPG